MLRLNLLCLALVAIFIQSCTVFSIHPLYEQNDLLFDEALEGKWEEAEDGNEFVLIDRMGDKMYKFRYCEVTNRTPFQADTVYYEAGLLKLSDHLFFDLYPYLDHNSYFPDEADYLFRNFIPVHSFLKVKLDGETMTLYMFDGGQMRELFEQNRIRIKHEMLEDYIVITASTPELQRFIIKYSDDEKAFDDPGIFKRIE